MADAKHFEGRERTQEILREFGWFEFLDVPGEAAPYGLSAQFWDHTLEHVVGGLWERPQMNLRDRELIMIALIAATPSKVGLIPHLRNAHYLGFSADAMREILLMVAWYAGWPKAAEAMVLFEEIAAQPDSPYRGIETPATDELPQGNPMARAEQVLSRLGWDNHLGDHSAASQRYGRSFHEFSMQHLYGGLWARPGLSLRDRELVAIALTLAASSPETLSQHFENAHKLGITAATLIEVILTTAYYSGWPKAGGAVRLLREIVGREGSPYLASEV
ncbi:carboxymuconolactone decarboxylase family protein [Ramlibacter sp. 2FC]|uniref:carboxymuconolactone decarboxylase family protein n=1 Tax=Ramlibacter sp. 2FC TaxID=2502188 RepID=UPI0010F96DC2|nr:carboxymuconolactone decarboxylase family protein [Ramlibacter sp. 2FC]